MDSQGFDIIKIDEKDRAAVGPRHPWVLGAFIVAFAPGPCGRTPRKPPALPNLFHLSASFPEGFALRVGAPVFSFGRPGENFGPHPPHFFFPEYFASIFPRPSFKPVLLHLK